MDIEQMKKDLGGGNVFPIGEENVAFAKYFTGRALDQSLSTNRKCRLNSPATSKITLN